MLVRIHHWVFALFLGGLGLVLALGGAKLLSLSGSAWYLLAGLTLIVVAASRLRGGAFGPRLYAAFLLVTLVWSLFEAGFDGWALAPRLIMLACIGGWMLLPFTAAGLRTGGRAVRGPAESAIGAVLILILGAFAVAGLRGHEVAAIAEGPVLAPERAADWPAYGGTHGGTRFAPLDEITPQTVRRLKPLWHVRTSVPGSFKATPLQIGDLLYLCTAGNVVIALDAESGAERWRFDPKVPVSRLGSLASTCRGVSYHAAPAGRTAECPTRIISGTTDARLFAVDAATGALCRGFGEDGFVDLWTGMGKVRPGYYFVTSPPEIAGDVAVVGGWVLDNQSVGEPSGVVRAFDVATGALVWAWDLGRPGETSMPPPGQTFTPGTPNVWSLMSHDPALGLIYAPTGNATPDYFDGHRSPGMKAYASSVVALDASTGQPRWSFQTVREDVWDYDVPSQPVLVDIPQAEGPPLPAVLVATKRGELFLLDRRDGTPVAPVEDRPVPQGTIPEDPTAPTQPFSSLPHFRPDLTEADMWGLTPLDQLVCRLAFRQMRYEGHFTPPGTDVSLQHPGNGGGFNWGSLAIDETRAIAVGAPLVLAQTVRLIPRAEAGDRRFGIQAGTPYAVENKPFFSPLMAPCTEPPFGLLAAIDLRTQRLIWKRPIGSARDLGPFLQRSHIDLTMGVPLQGGVMVTGGGLVFIGGTMDRRLRAVDIETGRTLWHHDLPSNAQATPMSYRAPRSGRQIVVLTVPGGSGGLSRMVRSSDHAAGEPDPAEAAEAARGGHVMAFALE